MAESFQYIMHSLELAEEKDQQIAEFRLNFLLRVPRSHIAIDIKTGFPNLIAFDRHNLDDFVRNQWQLEKLNPLQENPRPLQLLDRFMVRLEENLPAFSLNYPNIQIESVSLSTFIDVISHIETRSEFHHQ